MDDTVDVLDHPIDERARRAGAEVRRAASMRTLPDLPRARSRVGATVALTVAVAAVLIAGLIVIGTQRGDVQPAGPDDDLHWIIEGLPQGWAPVDVRGPGTGAGSNDVTGGVMSIFGTSIAPEGPIFETFVSVSAQTIQPASQSATNYDERTVDGVDVVLASGPGGSRLAWVDLDGGWLQVLSAGMTDEQLLDLAAHLTVDASGSVQVSSDHGPAGLARLATGTIAKVAPAFWSGLGMQGKLPGTVTVDYRQGTDGGYMSLTVSRPVAGQLVYQVLSRGVAAPVEIDGLQVWQMLNDDGLPVSAAWQRDGLLFVLGTSEPGALDLPALAAGVRPATPTEWEAARSDEPVQPSADAPAGTVLATDEDNGSGDPLDAPASTDPPAVINDEVRDIDLPWTITDERPHEATLAATLPDGFQSEVSVVVVGDSISMGSPDLGSTIFPWPDAAPTRLEAQGIGAIAVTHDDRATQLRVQRANGDRYTVDLVTLSGEPQTHFAIVTLPGGQFVSSDLLDAQGNVLDHFDHF